MAAKPKPVMAVKPRRMASPHPAMARAKLEPIHQPLYSALVLGDAITPALQIVAETTWFQYAQGQQVSGPPAAGGTVPSSLIHTNMEIASAVATPKVFLIEGVRVVRSNCNATLGNTLAPSDGGNQAPSSMFDDLKRIQYGTYFRLHIGAKDYLKVPTWCVPSNVGIAGVAETDLSDIAAGADAFRQYAAAHMAGQPFKMPRFPILIPSQQSFFAALVAPQVTRPTVVQEQLVYCFLDGTFGREVQ